MPSHEDKISFKLRTKFPGGMSVVSAGGTYAGLPLYQYVIDSHTKLREAFEIIDGVEETIDGLETAAEAGDLDRPAARAEMSVEAYVAKQIEESKERSWAKADVMWSFLTYRHASLEHD